VYVYVQVCMSIYIISVWLRVVMIMDSLVRSQLSNRRFGFVPIVDPIHWRFEDRPMR